MSQFSFPITLQKGTKIQDCSKFNEKGLPISCPSQTQLVGQNTGELRVVSPTQVQYFSPEGCIQGAEDNFCLVQFTLPESELRRLINQNQGLGDFLRSEGISLTSTTNNNSSTTSGFQGSVLTGNSRQSQDAGQTSNGLATDWTTPLALYGGSFLLLLAFVVIFYKPLKNLIFGPSDASTRQPQRKTTARQPLPTYSTDNAYSVNQSNLIAEEVRRQLSPLRDKINTIELALLALEQKVEVGTINPVLSSKSASLGSQLSSGPANQPTSIPTSPPPPLSVDIIKQAVASVSYNLISAYPHEFLSETAESRQGLTDKRQFTVEGSQSQASTRSQSEFIAIPCANEVYLIPNILANAADPARTLKRHVDRNSIYKAGSGSNLLVLQELALVRRSGDGYELQQDGRIA